MPALTTPAVDRPFRSALHRLQDDLARRLGVGANRSETAAAMLANNLRRLPGYWIQLYLSAGIATLGLALGSTAVVIGAMLISPLMGPLIEFGMGFAVGSSLLVLSAAMRIGLSIAGVVGAAAVMTLGLPFHEVTAEIGARTSPTLLDLLIAVFCALMAAFATLKQAEDTASAAAGTAIGIALVPPLCVAGFGLGTGSLAIASGAALLFTANLSAIIVVAVLVFLLLGYARVDAVTIERQFIDTAHGRMSRVAERAHQSLGSLFGSRYGLAMRVLVPLTFVVIVYVPLSAALDNVAREVRLRQAVKKILAEAAPRAMQQTLSIERDAVALDLVIVGTPDHAAALRTSIRDRIASATDVPATVSVTAVADARALQAATSARQTRSASTLDLAQLRARIADVLGADWPAAAGTVQRWYLTVDAGERSVLMVAHSGGALGPAGREVEARRLSERLGTEMHLAEVTVGESVSPEGVDRASVAQWAAKAAALLTDAAASPDTVGCVTTPRTYRADRGDAILQTLTASPLGAAGRLQVSQGTGWSVRIALSPCEAQSAVQAAPTRK